MKLTRLFALLMALVMTFSVASCAMAEDAAAMSESDVLVTVNETEITRGEILEIASNLLYTYGQQGYDTSDESLMNYVSNMAVEFSIQYALLDQQAKLKGYDQFTDDEMAAFDAEAEAEWTEIVDMYVTYYGGLTAESTEEDKINARTEIISMLEGSGYTKSVLLDNIVENAKYERIEADMVAGAVVTPEDVQAVSSEHLSISRCSSSLSGFEFS